jgi:hypothetical protein
MTEKHRARLRAEAAELKAQIEAFVFSGRAVPEDLLRRYDEAEVDDRVGIMVFTLCEQASLPLDERDSGWSWVPELKDMPDHIRG